MGFKEFREAAPRHRLLIASWLVFLVVYYSVMGILGEAKAIEQKSQAIAEHKSIIDPNQTELGKTQADKVDGPTRKTLLVHSGMYIERITDLSPKESTWTVDFYVWFRWDDKSSMPAIDPGTSFQVIDGAFVIPPLLIDENTTGAEHYALYRAKAKITKVFNMSRFPRDDHMLTLRIEDKRLSYAELQYVPDFDTSDISSRVNVPGYKIISGLLLEKPHTYKTNRGNVRLGKNAHDTHSQLLYAILVERPGWGLYLKLFQGMLAAVSISLLAFLVRPTEKPRFPLGIGAFFASVASTYITTNQLPGVDLLTLTDVVNGVGMSTIFFTLVSSIISLHLYTARGNHSLSKAFDQVCLLVSAVGVVVVNVAVVGNAAL